MTGRGSAERSDPESAAAPGAPALGPWGRLRYAWFRLLHQVNLGGAAVYLGIASLLGADGLALLVGAAAVWPVGIGALIAVAVGGYLARGRIRALARRLSARQ